MPDNAAVSEPTKDRNPLANTLMGMLSNQYGPIGFGVAALLLIWWQIVGPELAAARQDRSAMQNVADTIKLAVDGAKEAAITSRDTAVTSKATADANERAAQNLDNAADSLKDAAEALKKP